MSVHTHLNQSAINNATGPLHHPVKGFCRVTRYRPCRVCGKTDWCGYSVDQATSICMRVRGFSNGTSRNGGYIHHHETHTLTGHAQSNTSTAPPANEVAALEIRNAVYEELIRRSPAQKYYSQLVDGPNGLLSRGLGKGEIETYGALPRTGKERASLARVLRKFVATRFPKHAPHHTDAGILSVPGFWEDASTGVQLWKSRDYNMPVLVIPYRDDQGRIQACQLRLHRNDVRVGDKKYRWLSSSFEPRGASSGTPIHFTFNTRALPPGQIVIITEGALKAQTLVSLRPRARVIATSGVSCSHADIIAAVRAYNVLIAFDSDHKSNPAVARQLARLIAAREQESAAHQLLTRTKILSWERCNGIDDAVLANVELEAKTILQWISTLQPKPVQEVRAVWNQMGYTPPLAG